MPRQKQRVRERVIWSPTWDKVIEGYTVKFCQKNSWRCDHIHQVIDLMQDAYLVFVKVRDAYPRVVEARHFMALYKRALANNVHDKSAYKRRKDAAEVYLSADVSEFCVGRIGEVTNAGYVAALIAEMPEELRMVLNRLAQGVPQEPRRRGLQPRESLTMQLRRLLRLPINSDPMTMIKRVLTN